MCGARRYRLAKRPGRKAVARRATERKATKRNARARTTARPKSKKKGGSTASKAKATVTGALKGAVVAFTKRLPGAQLDAVTLLENDHRRLEDLLARGEKAGTDAAKTRTSLLDTLAAELTVHETIEEKVLSPALEAHPETRDIVLEGFQEHHVADLIVKELYDTSVANEVWAAKFKVLKENLEHHI